MSLLGRSTGPTDLSGLPTAALSVLAQEIRAFLIDKVSAVCGQGGLIDEALARYGSTPTD